MLFITNITTTTKFNIISNKILYDIQNKETKEEVKKDFALLSAKIQNCSQAINKTLNHLYKNENNCITIIEFIANYSESLLKKKKKIIIRIFDIIRNV